MSLDARSIAIGVSVVLLGVIGWMLVANSSEESPSATSLEAVSTTIAPVSSTTTSVTATTTAATTTTVASTTTGPTPTTMVTTTTAVRPETPTTPVGSTVTIPPPLEDPDLTMCRENDIPDRQCAWVGVEYPKVDADPEEEPLMFLRQVAAFLTWSDANPEIATALMPVATTGDFLEKTIGQLRNQLEEQKVLLNHVSIEGPVEVVDASDDTLVVDAIVIAGQLDVIIDGELDNSDEASPPTPWRFELVVDEDEGWVVSWMEPRE